SNSRRARSWQNTRMPLGALLTYFYLIDFNGGAERDRTADLVNAIHALSQLSYGPDRLGTTGELGSPDRVGLSRASATKLQAASWPSPTAPAKRIGVPRRIRFPLRPRPDRRRCPRRCRLLLPPRGTSRPPRRRPRHPHHPSRRRPAPPRPRLRRR